MRLRLQYCVTILLISGFGAAAQPIGIAPGLTPTGAEQAGNAAGTIPSWTGGLPKSEHPIPFDQQLPDPFAGDQKLFSISAENLETHRDHLSAFEQAMLARYPNSYRLDVFPTRRSCSLPQIAYDALAKNAQNAKLVNDGNGISGALLASPFPMPKNGLEVYWNHNLAYRAPEMTFKASGGTVYPNGHHTHVIREDLRLSYYHNPETPSFEALDNVESQWRGIWSSPPRISGAGFSMTNTIDQIAKPRNGFMYRPDTRRVMQAPPSAVSYDAPLSSAEGTRNSDNIFLVNGAPDRFEWKLIGKREMYIPYNVYKPGAEGYKVADLATPYHVNPDLIRYELHRVWVVETTLKPGFAHPNPRRVFYFDEDSWIAVGSDLYNAAGELVGGQVGYVKNEYTLPACEQEFDVIYTFESERYNLDNVKLDFGRTNTDAKIQETDFGSAALRRSITR
jgi:hypothetical protein